MTHHYDLSIIVPGIREEHWETLYQHAKHSCRRHSYEMIFSGPKPLPASLQQDKHVKYLKNYGSPTRALHLGTRVADGRFFTWVADDAHLYPDAMDAALDLLLSRSPDKDIVCMRYCEGQGHSGGEPPANYWVAGTHPDLHCPGVDRSWKIPLVMLVSLQRYAELGGLDCRFEHTNMNVIDLGFRAQMDGSEILMSPTLVQNCDWEPTRTAENSPVIAAFVHNDRPLFHQIYAEPGKRPIKIEENWRGCEPHWKRRDY